MRMSMNACSDMRWHFVKGSRSSAHDTLRLNSAIIRGHDDLALTKRWRTIATVQQLCPRNSVGEMVSSEVRLAVTCRLPNDRALLFRLDSQSQSASGRVLAAPLN